MLDLRRAVAGAQARLEKRPKTAAVLRNRADIPPIQTMPIEYEPVSFDKPARFNSKTVTAAIASFPPRIGNLRYCVDSLYDQCDHICVYLNGYDSIPDFLDRPKVFAFLSKDFIDLNAIGKVFFIDWARDGYYFTIDDDFVYPSNYIQRMVETIDLYKRRCAVTVHGSVFPESFKWYYERTVMYQYQAPLQADRFVHLPGTGSFGFHKSTMKAEFRHFLPQIMVDLTFAILCKRQRVPLVCVSRPAMWMMNTERSGLFQQFSKTITHHTHYATAEMPWSFEEYSSYVEPVISQTFGNLREKRMLELNLDTDFLVASRRKETPNTWKTSMTTMRRKMDAMKLETVE